jgi:hypothetical protein
MSLGPPENATVIKTVIPQDVRLPKLPEELQQLPKMQTTGTEYVPSSASQSVHESSATPDISTST